MNLIRALQLGGERRISNARARLTDRIAGTLRIKDLTGSGIPPQPP